MVGALRKYLLQTVLSTSSNKAVTQGCCNVAYLVQAYCLSCTRYKVKAKLSLCSTNHHATKTYPALN